MICKGPLKREWESKLTIMSGRGIFTFVSIISVLFALLRSIYKTEAVRLRNMLKKRLTT